MQLTNSDHLGSTANVVADPTTAKLQAVKVPFQDKPSSLRQIPYTINTDEIQGAAEILAGVGSVLVDSSTTVPVINTINDYLLITARGEAIAQDVFIPSVKENVVFNAENSVLAMAFLDPRLNEWAISEVVELYGHFDGHPNFEAIVRQVREAKALRYTDEKIVKQIE